MSGHCFLPPLTIFPFIHHSFHLGWMADMNKLPNLINSTLFHFRISYNGFPEENQLSYWLKYYLGINYNSNELFHLGCSLLLLGNICNDEKVCLLSSCLFIFYSRIYLQTSALDPLHPRANLLVGHTLALSVNHFLGYSEFITDSPLLSPSQELTFTNALLYVSHSAKCFACIISLNSMK